MYYLYKRTLSDGVAKYQSVERISLFGCRNGLLPKALSVGLPSGAGEPYQWHLSADDIVQRLALRGNAILIDADPRNEKTVNLHRLRDVYGHSESAWTPMLWHCDRLMNGLRPVGFSRTEFEVSDDAIDEHIFTWAYARGTVARGRLEGTWNAPRPATTNGPFLWPHVVKYFMSVISDILVEAE